MRILLIRHGEPDYAHDSLTEKGFREAALLSERMERLDPDVLYVSPMGRAQATAAPTLKRLGKTAETLDWLQEFPGRIFDENGVLRIPWNLLPEDWTREEAMYDAKRWLTDSRMASGDVPACYEAVRHGLEALLARHGLRREGGYFRGVDAPDVMLAMFCHFGVSVVMLSMLLGVAVPPLWQGMFLAPSSVTQLVTEERTPGIISFRCLYAGDASHLYAANEPISGSGCFYCGRLE